MSTGGRIEIMHGVNFDQLGRRNPELYGTAGRALTLPDLERRIGGWAEELGLRVQFFQSNHEGEFVERLHALEGMADGIVINAGAWTHYAWAIRDALEIAALPAVEVHISDVMDREPWRRASVVRDLCVETVSGQGPDGYRVALERLRSELAA